MQQETIVTYVKINEKRFRTVIAMVVLKMSIGPGSFAKCVSVKRQLFMSY